MVRNIKEKFIHTKMINSPAQAVSQTQAVEEEPAAVETVTETIEAVDTLTETVSPDQIAQSIAEIGIVEAGQERIKITEINSNASNTEAKAKEERPLDFANLNYKPQTE